MWWGSKTWEWRKLGTLLVAEVALATRSCVDRLLIGLVLLLVVGLLNGG